MLNDRKRTKQDTQYLSSTKYLLNMTIVHLRLAQGSDSCLLRQHIDIIWIFHTIEIHDNLRAGVCNTTTDGCLSPCFAERLENDEVVVFIQKRQHRAFVGKVNIGFIDNNDKIIVTTNQFLKFVQREGVA